MRLFQFCNEFKSTRLSGACKGIDNLPKNWDEFKKLLCEIGINSEFPF